MLTRRKSLLLAGAAAIALALPRPASAQAPSFTIASLLSTASCYSGFPSTDQHVARNGYGTFYCVSTKLENLSNATGDFSILWNNGTTIATLWSQANMPTNMMGIAAFSTGELYAAYADIVNGYVVVLYWPNVTQSTTPQVLQMSGMGCAGNVKTGFIPDEGRRCLYIIGAAGYLFRVSDAAVEIGRQHVFQPVTDQPNYFVLRLDDDGKLYAVFCNAMIVAGGTDYDANTAIMTPNPDSIGGNGSGASWYAGPWPGATLTLPIDPGFNGQAVIFTRGAQYNNNNNLLIDAFVNKGTLHIANSQATAQAERFFGRDDLLHCNVEAIAASWVTGVSISSTAVHEFLRDQGQGVIPRACSGGFAQRASGLYLVLHDRSNIVAMRSTDDGATWAAYAVTAVPGLGTDTIHFVSVMTGKQTDTDIVGMFTVEHCTPSQWANGTEPVPPAYAAGNPTASVFSFSLPV